MVTLMSFISGGMEFRTGIRRLSSGSITAYESSFTMDGSSLACPVEDGTLMTSISEDGKPLRLLVRARRVAKRSVPLDDDTQTLPGWAATLIFAAPLALAGLLLIALVELLRRLACRQRIRRMKL